ncbi:Conjugal transfer protein TraG [Gemmata obscuriglobus]|uniref:Uncharacterized protein n=1 Tax=Gemmata obscuriglobus TaxID=114 RepID=A0A2Z3H301_9BACT|nr:type IV secretory system conjugative DNA transfer family protein [Gemmata obscuriglobus]AWM40138.1 hypothetical protein C1280_26125 [Gemmata obscuriglobus]QEG26686.1 Conjugal transfer protein TraG [Gemmata obscuriglobus]VTS02347.1 conjugal transfer protein : Type IV secretory pathway, VirD4 component OS=Singulisphaera acidiphila (strain ATCC BAA-1392 / DSM 18658 / VKM B-2454 / MOB10) GN=Sinac_7665 PE=4 SV=1: T4SS-DNA_transf [Gemmata obscuriglobus UQM 2246]
MSLHPYAFGPPDPPPVPIPMATGAGSDEANLAVLVIMLFLLVVAYFGRRRLSRTAHGTAAWMTERELRRWGLYGRRGLVIGRSQAGRLLRNTIYVHTLIIGGTGSGKGIGLILPILLEYRRGSVVVFDTKGDLYQITARRRRRLGPVARLNPFGTGARWNPLDTIPPGDPLLIDNVRSMACGLVVASVKAVDPHWDGKATQLVAAVLTLVAIKFPADSRNLNSVYETICDPELLRSAAEALRAMGGFPGSQGAALGSLFDRGGTLTKEGTGVVSTALRHLDFLASPAVAASVAASDIDPREFLRAGGTLYLTIPESQLAAQQGLLRLWTSTLMRIRGGADGECLMLLDEASALGALPALEEALVRGRSSGLRLLLAYQSCAQVQAAFPEKPTLIFDNTSAHIYLGAASLETAERISKSLGNFTQAVSSYADNWSRTDPQDGAGSTTWGGSENTSVLGRPLLYPDEVLRLPVDLLIAFVAGLPGPILARRIQYYADRHYRRILRPWRGPVIALLVAALVVAAAVLAAR